VQASWTGVFRLTGKTFLPRVVHGIRTEPEERDHAAEEQIDFREVSQRFERPAAEKSIIGVVEYHADSQPTHHSVKALGGPALENPIGGAAVAYSVDDIATS
jgi:hypothetical protein